MKNKAKQRAARLGEQLIEAQRELQAALAADDAASLRKATALVARLTADQERVLADVEAGVEAPGRPARPFRDQVADIAADFGDVATPKMLSDWASVRYGFSLPTTNFGGLRRDERRRYERGPGTSAFFVLPAIHADELTPVPAWVTLSTFPLCSRLLTSLTPRAAHLRFCSMALAVAEPEERGARAAALARRLASVVPELREPLRAGEDLRPLVAERLATLTATETELREEAAARLADEPPWVVAFGRGSARLRVVEETS